MRLLPIALLALAGCVAQPVSKPAAPAGAGEQVVTAQTVASNAEAAAKDAERERLEKLSANVNAAATAPNIEAAPVAVNELTVAQGRLSDITPDPQEQAAAAERRALVEAGRAEEARQNAIAAAEAGRRDAALIVELRATAARLAAERDKLTAELIAQAERNRIANEAALAKARDEARNGVLRGQVAWLNRIGFGCMAVAIGSLGVGLAIGGVAAIRRVGPLAVVSGVGALLCFGTAQIVGAPWFLWAVGGVLLVLVTWFAVWAWKHQKRGDLASELATRTGKVAAVAKAVVPVLDAAYEQADEATRRWLDAKIFDRLSSLMNRDEKATIHEIRKEATP
jgi:hypothetical protein